MRSFDPNLTILTLKGKNIVDFAAARNALLATVKTTWVLYLDSDEELSPELVSEIKTVINNPHALSAYRLIRQDYFMGRVLHGGEVAHTPVLRLARRDYGHWIRPVHEVWVPTDSSNNPVGQLKHPLFHRPHSDLKSFWNKIDRYSEIEATYRYSLGITSSIFHIFFYPLGKFLQNYLIRRGYRDGVVGFIHATLMSFHSYATWTKLYLLWQQH